MSESSVEQHIDAVDAYARTLFLRTRQNPDLFDITDAVRQLHIALRHLRIEAGDPDSLLASKDSVYSRQLRPLVDSSAHTLGLLEDALDDSDMGSASDSGDVALQTARRRLKGEKASLDGFLDAVQLQKSKAAATIDAAAAAAAADQGALDQIQDKVDQVAKRVFSRRDSGFVDDEDYIWKEFQTELEREGFSPTVLEKHKDVLRAYIRRLEAMSSRTDDPPSVRGILEYEAESQKTQRPGSNKQVAYLDMDNSKFSPILSLHKRAPGGEPPPIPPKESLPELESPPPLPSRPSFSSEDADEKESVGSMSLILTKDIMDMDMVESGMTNIHLNPGSQPQLPSSPDPKYLAYHPYSSSAEATSKDPQLKGQPKPWTGLAPDRYGKEIPMNAQWTRINRNLVSPEVLARAGVRYEARPAYVAVLGRLSREQIADFARQSADCRAARAMRQNPPRAGNDARNFRERTDSKSSRDDIDDEYDDESDLFDESDTTESDDDRTSEKGTKSYPFIVSPPSKTSPSATVKPKSILKNRNENHVRFDPEPREMSSKSPGSFSYRDERSSPERRRRRGDDDRDHRASGHHNYRSGSGEGPGGDRYKSRSHYDDRDNHHHRRHRGDRERDRDRERERERERRNNKKKVWGETLGAVGLGGAAVSLLTVLAEAAT